MLSDWAVQILTIRQMRNDTDSQELYDIFTEMLYGLLKHESTPREVALLRLGYDMFSPFSMKIYRKILEEQE